MECKKCNLHKTSCTKYEGKTVYKSCMMGVGPKDTQLMLIGEALGAAEILKGVPFVGKAGQLLSKCLERAKIERKELYVSNVVKCRPPRNRQPLQSEVNACAEYLDKEIEEIKPKVIGLLGNTACQRILDKSGTVKLHGRIFKSKKYNAYCIPLLHPAYVLRNPRMEVEMIKDLIKVRKLLESKEISNNPTKESKLTEFIVCDSVKKVKLLSDQLLTVEKFSFDLETSNFDYLTEDILCIGFSIEKGKAIIVPFYINGKKIYDLDSETLVWNYISRIFDSKKIKIAHNLKFDWHFLKSKGLYVRWPFKDTLIMSYLLDENARGRRSLKDLSFEVDMGFYDREFQEYVESKKVTSYSEIPDKLLWRHCSNDADCTLRLYNLFENKIEKENLELVLNKISLPLLEALLEMEHTGVCIDLEYVKKLDVELDLEIKAINKKLSSLDEVADVVDENYFQKCKTAREKYKGSKNLQHRYTEAEYIARVDRAEFNFNSSIQIAQLLFDKLALKAPKMTATGRPSTDGSVLELLKNNPVCRKLLEYRKLTKLHNTYVKNIPNIIGKDGRLHTQYNQIVTVTGRLSSSKPNLQNIPKGGAGNKVRNYFIAGKGNTLVEADFGQIEFRVWASASEDTRMINDITSGRDIHRVVSAAIHQISISEVTDEQRRVTKSIVFGLMYGRGLKSIMEEFKIPYLEAKKISKSFFGKYPKAAAWLRKTQRMAKKRGYVLNIFGRKRRLLDINSTNRVKEGFALRQAINSPIQSAASDITSIATVRVYKKLKEKNYKTKILMTIHDSIVLEVPEEELSEVAKMVKFEMERPVPFVKVPLKIDIQVGKKWGSMKPFGG